MKFTLATDAEESKLRFPIDLQPKIDGVRGGYLSACFTGRSLKPPKNRYVAQFFSEPVFFGIDGEMAAEHECHPSLCRLTSSAMSTHEGQPWLLWHAFDYITAETQHLEYALRYEALSARIAIIKANFPHFGQHLKLVPSTTCYSLEDVMRAEDKYVKMGYEGIILRDRNGKAKQGRSTVREQILLRIKRYSIDDAVVYGLEEGEKNLNEATRDARGYIERSTHKENMVPNGKVGTLLCHDCKTKQPIRVSAGRMTHDERELYLKQPELIIGKTIKYQNFLHGVKDAPRQATFQCIRSEDDIDPDA